MVMLLGHHVDFLKKIDSSFHGNDIPWHSELIVEHHELEANDVEHHWLPVAFHRLAEQ